MAEAIIILLILFEKKSSIWYLQFKSIFDIHVKSSSWKSYCDRINTEMFGFTSERFLNQADLAQDEVTSRNQRCFMRSYKICTFSSVSFSINEQLFLYFYFFIACNHWWLNTLSCLSWNQYLAKFGKLFASWI